MGRELQKKKRRSGRHAVRPKKPAKVLNPRGNSVIAKNWDKKETLAQNYRRLGLVARLRGATGGSEKPLASAAAARPDPLAIAGADAPVVSEARVERDASGAIVRVLGRRPDNPLLDPLASDSDADADADADAVWGAAAETEARAGTATGVVCALLDAARNPAPRRVRHQSDAERLWLQRLVARHGGDTAAMARDLKLNPMQQTAADIAKRLDKMRKST